MLINIYKPASEVTLPYHINPYMVVGVCELDGWYYVDAADRTTRRIDRDSYQRVITWLEQAR